MPMTDEDAREIKAMLLAAKRVPVNFGFCLGQTGEEAILEMSRTRSPGTLGRLAKEDGDTSRLARGTVSVEKNFARFKVIGRIPAGLRKQIKLCLRSIGLQHKVFILDETGAEV